MATYDFSTLIASGNASQSFLPTDVLTFIETINAADLIVATSGANTTIRLSTGFILTLTGFAQNQSIRQNLSLLMAVKLSLAMAWRRQSTMMASINWSAQNSMIIWTAG
jgi:hypothetical protein